MNVYLAICEDCSRATSDRHYVTIAELVAARSHGHARALAHTELKGDLSYYGAFCDWKVTLHEKDVDEAAGVLPFDHPLWDKEE